MTSAEAWPGDSVTVVEWIRASLQPDDAGLVRGLDDVRITADVSGNDVDRLVIDATGVKMSLHPAARSDEPPAMATGATAPAEPEVVQRSRGVLRTARVVADPVRIEGIPLRIHVELHDTPVEWLVYASPLTPGRPETIRNLEPVEGASGMRGSLRVSMRANQVSRLLTRIARPLLAASGVHMRRLSATVEQDGADGLRVAAAAGIRWRLLWASARGTARIGISTDGVITVRDLTLGSRNPIVALALRAARGTVRQQIGQTFDLNAGLPADAPRLHDVRVVVAEELTASARVS